MYDSPRQILCDDCSACALTYEAGTLAEVMEGRLARCEGCGQNGRVYLVEDDEFGGPGDLRFRPDND